jgi:CTP synthase
MLKFLFVDDQLNDDSSSASIAAKKLESIDEYSVTRSGFGDAEKHIEDIVPDLVIIDLQEESDSGDHKFTGTETCEWIWRNRFCPIVVYSAFPDHISDDHKSHPFVEVVTKGRKGVEDLESSITKLRPHIDSIREAEQNIRNEFSVAMREVAPYAYEVFKSDPTQRDNAIIRSGRRRLAAFMDGLSNDGNVLASWEQYLFPPVCQDTQLGDVLRKSEGNQDDPASFRIVLTPSCDLVASNGRNPKIDKVLVANCCSTNDGLELMNQKMASKKLKSRLPNVVLSRGYFEAIIPLPCLEGRIPTMMADLRSLEFIPIAEIGLSDKTFLRIASIDSPFRELISWAYLQIACRPGLPDRDFNSWCDEIIASLPDEGNIERT